MQGLGYERYGAHGGDFGAGVATHMALIEPERMIGIHLSTPEMAPYAGPDAPPLTAAEQRVPRAGRRAGTRPSAATAPCSPPGRRPSGTG